jgi:hypothetical protein
LSTSTDSSLSELPIRKKVQRGRKRIILSKSSSLKLPLAENLNDDNDDVEEDEEGNSDLIEKKNNITSQDPLIINIYNLIKDRLPKLGIFYYYYYLLSNSHFDSITYFVFL